VLSASASASYAFEAEAFPRLPGCYLMFDATDRLLYVGKAKDLRRRLSCYFHRGAERHRKAEMVERIRRIEVVLARNEREALVLESNLIRHHTPPYNSRFTRVGDSYYYIALTDEAYPRFVGYRRDRVNYALTESNGAYLELFGPYMGWRLRNRILEAVRERFPLRTCHRMPRERCIRRDSGLCSAPCLGRIPREAYQALVATARRFLQRPPRAALRALERDMREAAACEAFEEAQRIRDQLRALRHAALPQAVECSRGGDREVVWWGAGSMYRLQVRDGAVVNAGPFEDGGSPSSVRDGLVRRYSSSDAQAWIVNRPAAAFLVQAAGDAERVSAAAPRLIVPRSDRSRIGQLLELCRINHDFYAGWVR
jgi:excinuclease ABC subunit C